MKAALGNVRSGMGYLRHWIDVAKVCHMAVGSAHEAHGHGIGVEPQRKE